MSDILTRRFIMEFGEAKNYAPKTKRKKSQGELHAFLQNFSDSGIECAQVFDWESDYVDASSLAATLCITKKRMGYDHIKVSRILDDVYLINTSFMEEKLGQTSRMRFEEVDYAPCQNKRPRGELQTLLEKFIDSGIRCSKVSNWESKYQDAQSCAAAIYGAAQRLGFDHIKVSRSSGIIYLTNMLIMK